MLYIIAMDLTPKQQTSEAIRQAETVLIITGQHPSVDQVSAVIALSAILRKFGKKVTAIVTDNPPASVTMLENGNLERGLGGSRDFVLKVDVSKVELDKLRYEVEGSKLNIHLTPFKGSFAASDVTFAYGAFHYDLAVVLGVPTRSRIDRIYDQNMSSFETIPMVNLDFHRSNESYGAVNLIEPNASSLCEMLVALSESLQSGIIDAEIATALFMGIVASTDRFTATHTSPKSLTVAAQMMAAGARHQAVIRALYRDGKGEARGDRGGSDRSNQNDRNSERNGDRSGQSQQGNQQRASASSHSPQTAQVPHVSRNDAPVSAPIAASRNEPTLTIHEPVLTEELPIIQPGHIELSIPDEPANGRVTASAGEAPTNVAPTPPQPVIEQTPPQGRSQAIPIADFAAAAEMFRREPSADESNPSQQS